MVPVVAMVPVVSNGIASLAAVSEPWAPTITSTVAFIVTAAHVLLTTICAWTGLLALVPASLVLDFIILRCLDLFGLQCVLGVCGLFNRLLWLVILAHMTEVVGMRVPATALLTEDARVSAAITPSTTPGTLSVFLVALIPAFLIRTMRVVAMVPVVSNGIASLAAVSEPWAPTITSTVAFIVTAAHVLVTTICAWTGL